MHDCTFFYSQAQVTHTTRPIMYTFFHGVSECLTTIHTCTVPCNGIVFLVFHVHIIIILCVQLCLVLACTLMVASQGCMMCLILCCILFPGAFHMPRPMQPLFLMNLLMLCLTQLGHLCSLVSRPLPMLHAEKREGLGDKVM